MCKSTTIPQPSSITVQHNNFKRKITLLIWPVHPFYIIAIIPLLPTWLYLNRGYTIWYHYATIIYLLTNREPLRRFIILQGTSITLGWYAALASDYYLHGRFAHILYMNMPSIMKRAMVDHDGHVVYNPKSLVFMVISHVLDTLAHPGIVYFLLNSHRSSGGRMMDVISSWWILLGTFLIARSWSLLHTYYNTGKASGWYFGYDVYHIHDLDSWMAAYVSEGLLFLGLVVYKLFGRSRGEAKDLTVEKGTDGVSL